MIVGIRNTGRGVARFPSLAVEADSPWTVADLSAGNPRLGLTKVALLWSSPERHQFVGGSDQVGEAALRGVGEAVRLIDLRNHTGAHPRMGAADVVPFVPLRGVTLADCARIAESVAQNIFERYQVPTYLYGEAARTENRKRLEQIRRGGFEGLRESVRNDPDRQPDFGPAELHPTAGATAVGARKFLIAFNIKLNTSSVDVARKIAGKIRESNANSGLEGVKAMGVFLESQQAVQVSVNVTDYEKTPLSRLFRRVADEARREGTEAVAGEIVGLIPRAALESDPEMKHAARIENFHSDVVLETRLARAGAESGTLLDLPRNTK